MLHAIRVHLPRSLMGLVRLFVEATSYINITGFPQSYAVLPQNKHLRRFFVVCTFCCICGFMVQAISIFNKYYEYEIDTVVQLRFEALQYPAVTICNLNGYKKTAISKSPEMSQLMAAYSYVTYKQNEKSKKQKEAAESSARRRRKKRQAKVVDVVAVDDCTETTYQSHVHDTDIVYSSYLTCNMSNSFQACITACSSTFCFPGSMTSGECDLVGTVAYVDTAFHNCIYDKICAPQCQLCSQLFYNCQQNLFQCSLSGDRPASPCIDVVDSLCSLINEYCQGTPPTAPPLKYVPPAVPPDKLGESLEQLKEANATQYQQLVDEYETAVLEALPPEFLSLVADDIDDGGGGGDSPQDDVTTSDEIAIKVIERIQEITAELSILSPELRKELSYSQDETIISCSVNAKPCSVKDWTGTDDPDYGNCFTFNYNTSNLIHANRPGSFYGLRVIIMSNTSDYMFSSSAAGAKVTIHSAERDSFPSVEGFSVALGSYNAFSVKYQHISRLPHPYGDCVYYKDVEKYFYEKEYHNEGCFRSCFQEQLLEKCKCADSRYPMGQRKSKICSSRNTTDAQCLADFLISFPRTTMRLCQCGMPCTEGIYSITKTTTKWPRNSNFMARTCSESMLTFYNKSCRQIYEENAIFVDVFYDQLNYEVVTENPVYSSFQVFNNIIGSAGLFLSLTVPAVVEIIFIILQSIGFVFGIGQLPDVPSAYEEDSGIENDTDDGSEQGSDEGASRKNAKSNETLVSSYRVARRSSSESLQPYLVDSPFEPVRHISPQYPRFALAEDLALRPATATLFHRRTATATSNSSTPISRSPLVPVESTEAAPICNPDLGAVNLNRTQDQTIRVDTAASRPKDELQGIEGHEKLLQDVENKKAEAQAFKDRDIKRSRTVDSAARRRETSAGGGGSRRWMGPGRRRGHTGHMHRPNLDNDHAYPGFVPQAQDIESARIVASNQDRRLARRHQNVAMTLDMAKLRRI